jgi:DNA-directed RNA polymerase subunit beta'
VRIHGELQPTTVGRVLLSDITPPEIPFSDINSSNEKELGALIDLSFRKAGNKATVIFADRPKDMVLNMLHEQESRLGFKTWLFQQQKKKC